jgi:23S rRNA (guanosine2251-2'-O)-methyltransferase
LSEPKPIHGFHAVTAALKRRPESVREIWLDPVRNDPRARQITALAASAGVVLRHADARRLDGIVGGTRHQGVAALVDGVASNTSVEEIIEDADEPPLFLLLDGIQDPHNLGACLRVADAMGVHAVLAPKDRAVGMTATVRKVASGAAEYVPYLMVTNLARCLRDLKDKGFWVVGADAEGATALAHARLAGPLALVMGGEADGLRRLTRETCDELIQIPMLGSVESLNVSVATGICLYEARRQRGSPPDRANPAR